MELRNTHARSLFSDWFIPHTGQTGFCPHKDVDFKTTAKKTRTELNFMPEMVWNNKRMPNHGLNISPKELGSLLSLFFIKVRKFKGFEPATTWATLTSFRSAHFCRKQQAIQYSYIVSHHLRLKLRSVLVFLALFLFSLMNCSICTAVFSLN